VVNIDGGAGPDDSDLRVLSRSTIDRLLGLLVPGSSLSSVSLMKGGFTNFTHLVDATAPTGEFMRLVVRWYSDLYQDPAEKARVEYGALRLLDANDVPVATAMYLDEAGAVLGSPGIVTSFLPGRLVVSPRSQQGWAAGLANTLARIHSIGCDEPTRDVLFDAEPVVTYFLDWDGFPEKLASHLDGSAVWDVIQSLKKSARQVLHGLVHTDFWMGNVLWSRNEISGIIDWETAAYGDPAIDVAYCRMDMCMVGQFEAADCFLMSYEAATGRHVENLELWELVAVAGVMPDPARWLSYWQEVGDTWSTPESMRRNLSRFMTDALRRAAL
jgi:aminoglycoside phosphotransferase (APT) family kinase protein